MLGSRPTGRQGGFENNLTESPGVVKWKEKRSYELRVKSYEL
jgi:hypothetical protein